MIVTTKRGDGGKTDLFGGKRVPKSDFRIELIGTVDEIQALLGMIKICTNTTPDRNFIEKQQKYLYLCMGELAGAQKQTTITIKQWVSELETNQAKLIKKAKIQHSFVIPGVNQREAWCHIARTRIRFLERMMVKLSTKRREYIKYLPYINRLSDFFFVLSQYNTTK